MLPAIGDVLHDGFAEVGRLAKQTGTRGCVIHGDLIQLEGMNHGDTEARRKNRGIDGVSVPLVARLTRPESIPKG
jgi:hypothetical protein